MASGSGAPYNFGSRGRGEPAMTTRAASSERSPDQSQSATFVLLTTELAAWRCLECGSVCCIRHTQPSVCTRCGTRYVLHR